MTWAGTGVLWTIVAGVPRSMGIIGEATAAEPSGQTFLQISDSHVGFDKPANPNALGTLEEAINKIKTLPVKPSFIIHTGDITHLSKLSEFDDADRILSQACSDVHYVPGEHDIAAPQEGLGQPKIKHAASHLALLTSVAGSRGKCRNGEYPIDQDRSHPIRTKSLSQTVGSRTTTAAVMAVALLAKRGYAVAASTGRPETREYLEGL